MSNNRRVFTPAELSRHLLEQAHGQSATSDEPSASQPVSDAFRHQGLRIRRGITGERRQKSLLAVNDSYTRTFWGTSTEPLRDRVLTELRLRLKTSGIETEDLDQRFFAFIL